MKKHKKILSVIMILCLCILITIGSIPFATAKTTIKAPTNVEYYSSNVKYERYITFKHSDMKKADGYHIQISDASGKIVTNLYCKKNNNNSPFKNIKNFFRYDKKYGKFYCNTKPYIHSGQFYKIKVRAVKLKKHKKTVTKSDIKKATYSPYSKPTYVSVSIFNVKAKKTNKGKSVKITWGKVKGATGYDIKVSNSLFKLTRKSIKKPISTTKNTITLTKVDGISLKGKKEIFSLIRAKKKVSGKTYYGTYGGIFTTDIK